MYIVTTRETGKKRLTVLSLPGEVIPDFLCLPMQESSYLGTLHPKAKEPYLFYYLPIARVREEMNLSLLQGHYHKVKCKQSCPRFELGSVDFISNDDNHFAKCTSTTQVIAQDVKYLVTPITTETFLRWIKKKWKMNQTIKIKRNSLKVEELIITWE